MSDEDNTCEQAESELSEVVDGIPESKHIEFFFSVEKQKEKNNTLDLSVRCICFCKKLVKKKKQFLMSRKDSFCIGNVRKNKES